MPWDVGWPCLDPRPKGWDARTDFLVSSLDGGRRKRWEASQMHFPLGVTGLDWP